MQPSRVFQYTGVAMNAGNLIPGKWYFWDETCAEVQGPYDSNIIAHENLHAYSLYLGTSCPTGKCED